jgi:hypothetical protein
MSQPAFDTEINDSLMDWEAAHNCPNIPVVQEASAVNQDNDKDKAFPSSKTTIEAGRSIKLILVSGEYASPNLV